MHDAKILGLMIETNYSGGISIGIKHFEKYDNEFIRELRNLHRNHNRNPIADVRLINKAILGAISSKIRKIQRTNVIQGQEYLEALDSLKQEINRTLI